MGQRPRIMRKRGGPFIFFLKFSNTRFIIHKRVFDSFFKMNSTTRPSLFLLHPRQWLRQPQAACDTPACHTRERVQPRPRVQEPAPARPGARAGYIHFQVVLHTLTVWGMYGLPVTRACPLPSLRAESLSEVRGVGFGFSTARWRRAAAKPSLTC